MMARSEWQIRSDQLFDLLASYPSGNRTFNQYRDVHPELDLAGGAEVRRHNLRCYLESFAGVRYVLVGEATGYAGCRFSGIPFTCEAQLVGPEPLAWTRGLTLGRSSTAATPWVERSATMVWEALGERRDCLLWNAVPWHPFGTRGPLSNRHPGRDQRAGLEVLRCLLALFPAARPYAIGRVAQRALAAIGVEAAYIRHPSHGGKSRFAVGVATLSTKPNNLQ
jgi:hypothetical protein